MQIAKKDGFGVDAFGIRRVLFAGQPVPPGIVLEDESILGDEEIGHLGHRTGTDDSVHASETAAENGESVVSAQQYRSDLEGNAVQDYEREVQGTGATGEPEGPDPSASLPGLHTAPAPPSEEGEELTGEALRDRAAELDIKGRSKMNADELRDAIAEAEAEGEEVDE